MEESKVKTAEEENDNAFWTKQTDFLKLQSHITKLEANNKELSIAIKEDISKISDLAHTVFEHQRYINYPLTNLSEAGINSQNIMGLLDNNFTGPQKLWLHKLIFACEGLVKTKEFNELESSRVDLVCKYFKIAEQALNKKE